jgi:hypothetical protein
MIPCLQIETSQRDLMGASPLPSYVIYIYIYEYIYLSMSYLDSTFELVYLPKLNFSVSNDQLIN